MGREQGSCSCNFSSLLFQNTFCIFLIRRSKLKYNDFTASFNNWKWFLNINVVDFQECYSCLQIWHATGKILSWIFALFDFELIDAGYLLCKVRVHLWQFAGTDCALKQIKFVMSIRTELFMWANNVNEISRILHFMSFPFCTLWFSLDYCCFCSFTCFTYFSFYFCFEVLKFLEISLGCIHLPEFILSSNWSLLINKLNLRENPESK